MSRVLIGCVNQCDSETISHHRKGLAPLGATRVRERECGEKHVMARHGLVKHL